jgi:hypothetical protein
MATNVSVNNRTVVHAKSDGKCVMFPDVCKVPAPPAPVPTPFAAIGQSTDTADGPRTVKADGNPIMVKGSSFRATTGDEPGSLGGMASNTTGGKAEPINYSFDVKAEGRNVMRLGDAMVGNKGSAPNTPPMPEMQPPAVAATAGAGGKDPEQRIIRVAWK